MPFDSVCAYLLYQDLKYEDGDVPPSHLLREWLALVKKVFKNEKTADQTIAVHCMAGLGR